MAIDLKQSHRRIIEEAYGKGNLDVFDEVCASNYQGHDPLTGEADLAGVRDACRLYRAAFPDMSPAVLSSVAEGDTVVTRWRMTGTHTGRFLGLEPTGKRCTTEGISIGRFKAGKLAEEWTQWDTLGLFRQLGVAPELGAEPGAAAPEQRPHA